MAADGACVDVVHRMNEVCKVRLSLKSKLGNRGLWINYNKCLYDGVIVPTALYGAETWSIRIAEIRKVNVHEMK